MHLSSNLLIFTTNYLQNFNPSTYLDRHHAQLYDDRISVPRVRIWYLQLIALSLKFEYCKGDSKPLRTMSMFRARDGTRGLVKNYNALSPLLLKFHGSKSNHLISHASVNKIIDRCCERPKCNLQSFRVAKVSFGPRSLIRRKKLQKKTVANVITRKLSCDWLCLVDI